MAKVRVTNYTFDASAQTITFDDYASISLDGMLIITNVTDGIIIFNFADATKVGSVSTNVLTLDHDTTSMSDTDDLLIYYDDPASTVTLADNLANPIAHSEAAFNLVFDGSTWDRMPGTSADGVTVNLGSNNDVTVSGVATAANQLPDGHAVTVDNASGASAVNIQDGGNSITIDGTVTADLGATDNAVLDNIDTNTSNSSTSLAIMDDWDNAASDGASVSGDVAHDTADAGEPVKIGGKAVGENPTSVGSSDRVNAHFDTKGRLGSFLTTFDGTAAVDVEQDTDAALNFLLTSPLVKRTSTSNLMNAQVFDNVTTSANSSTLNTQRHAWVSVYLDVDSTNSPTRIQFIPQVSDDGGTTWWEYDEYHYQTIMFEDTEVASQVNKVLQLPAYGDDFRIRVVATGTSATNEFTVSIEAQAQNIR